uniref:LEM domain-containing protein n=1 Tax=Ditylenchus dipsaci TaxID=166011 RepID=A0A915DX65_9BILA
MSTALFGNLTNEELRSELEKHGVEVGPLTTTTRKVYEIKLLKIVQKKDNAEEFVQNLSFSDKSSRGTTPEPNAMPAANGDAGNNGFMSLRSGSPMARNGSPVVRNESPLARNGSPTLGNGPFAGNGVSTENSKKVALRNAREKKLLLNNTSESSVGTATMNTSIGQIFSRQKTSIEDHNNDYSDDGGNESARILSPEEVAKFRSGFSSLNNTDELISGIACATSEASSSMFSPYSQLNGRSKRRPPASAIVAKPVGGGFFSRPAPTSVLIVALLCFAVGLAVVFQANLTHLSGYGSSYLYNDEI